MIEVIIIFYPVRVVHCKNYTGDVVYIGRPSPLGNPFKLEPNMKKGSTLAKYEEWLRLKISLNDKEVCDELNRLYYMAQERALVLGCWCAPYPCHGDIIKKVLEEKIEEIQENSKEY